MRPSKVIQIAWKGLVKNKMRTLLTMLGVIIGVAAVIIMIAVSAGTEQTISDQITGLGSNLIFISQSFSRGGPGGGPEGNSTSLVYDDAAAIADKISGVAGVVVDQNSSETVKYGNVILESTSIMGTTPDFPSVRDMEIASGRYFNQADVDRTSKVAVLGSTLAEELFGSANPIGQSVRVGNTKLTVIGVFKEKGSTGGSSYDSVLFTPITVVFDKFTNSFMARVMGDRVRMIYAEVDEGASMDEVILQIELLLAKRHGVTLEDEAFSVTTQQDIIETAESTTASFRSLLAWVAGVSLVVGGIGIMNIMMVSVTERTREIGIRQSVGATPNDIRWQFLTEALLISLVGGLIGIVAGVGGSWLFGQLGSMRTVIVPSSIVLAFVSSAAVGIFFGYYPANKAAQLDPIEALRHE